jgi:ABC-type spermidine/putrescine transport system permease subunit II
MGMTHNTMGSAGSAQNSDKVLYAAIAGAVAVGLSLLVLPWFSLESFDWNDSYDITFNNLRDLYNVAKDSEYFDSDIRFLYLEWGYIVSYASAIFAVVTAFRLRDGKTSVSGSVLNAAVGATCVVGLWQGTIATALTQVDEDGSVQFGVWLGVIGHVALIASFVMMRQMMNRPAVAPAPGFQ